MKYIVTVLVMALVATAMAAPNSHDQLVQRAKTAKMRYLSNVASQKQTTVTKSSESVPPTFPVLLSPVCALCQWIVGDIEAGVVAFEVAVLRQEIEAYLLTLCEVDVGEDFLLRKLCENTVKAGIATAIGLVVNQPFPAPSTVCQAVGLCAAPYCPPGYAPSSGSPGLCLGSVFPTPNTYPAVTANCSKQAFGSHLCTYDELTGLNALDFAAQHAALLAQAASWGPAIAGLLAPSNPDTLAVIWMRSQAVFRSLIASQTVGTDPRVLVGFEDGDSFLYQLGVSTATGDVEVTSWFALDNLAFTANTLPYNFDAYPDTNVVLGSGQCCAYLIQ